MKLAKTKKKILSAIITFALVFATVTGLPAIRVYAASGTVYHCAINRCYTHPVTGVIEDSGGESSYATGQGMVEGCVYATGILEATDDGAYYLTIRMSLMDYTSGHNFQVQNVGDSGWSEPSEMGVTGNGSDSNGTTADVCMRVPSENCIIRCSMYVEPMGRDVIFYVYPSDYSEGNNTDMNATMVTESSDGTTETSGNQAGTAEMPGDQAGAAETSGNQAGAAENPGTTEERSGNNSIAAGNTERLGAKEEQNSGSSNNKESSGLSEKELQSSVKEAAKPSGDVSLPDEESSTLNSAEGLSLSTAKDRVKDEKKESDFSFGSHIFQIALAVVMVGLILIGAVSGVVYFFHKNWKRWGGAEDDDE